MKRASCGLLYGVFLLCACGRQKEEIIQHAKIVHCMGAGAYLDIEVAGRVRAVEVDSSTSINCAVWESGQLWTIRLRTPANWGFDNYHLIDAEREK